MKADVNGLWTLTCHVNVNTNIIVLFLTSFVMTPETLHENQSFGGRKALNATVVTAQSLFAATKYWRTHRRTPMREGLGVRLGSSLSFRHIPWNLNKQLNTTEQSSELQAI